MSLVTCGHAFRLRRLGQSVVLSSGPMIIILLITIAIIIIIIIITLINIIIIIIIIKLLVINDNIWYTNNLIHVSYTN